MEVEEEDKMAITIKTEHKWMIAFIVAVLLIGMFLQARYELFSAGGYCISEESTLTFSRADIYGGHRLAQSFKPGITGEPRLILLKIRKSTYGTPDDLSIEIKETLDGTALWRYTVLASQIETASDNMVAIDEFNIINPPTLTEENTYYLVLSSAGSGENEAYEWSYYAGTGETYFRGERWLESQGDWSDLSGDYWFVIDICGTYEPTCADHGGYICEDVTEICPVDWMEASDTTRCCPLSCEPATCIEGELFSYECPDGTLVDWCTCVNNEWDCIDFPEDACLIPCTDTCASLGFECGTQTVCGQSVDCGTCPAGETCTAGICEVVEYQCWMLEDNECVEYNDFEHCMATALCPPLCTTLEACEEHIEVCCKIYGLGIEMEEVNVHYEFMEASECSVPEGFDGGGRDIVENKYCECGGFLIGDFCLKWWMILVAGGLILIFLIKKKK